MGGGEGLAEEIVKGEAPGGTLHFPHECRPPGFRQGVDDDGTLHLRHRGEYADISADQGAPREKLVDGVRQARNMSCSGSYRSRCMATSSYWLYLGGIRMPPSTRIVSPFM